MKLKLSTVFALFFAFAAGAGLMYWWGLQHTQDEAARMQALFEAREPAGSLLQTDLQHAELAEGVQDAGAEQNVLQKGSELPSQLSPINLEGVSEIYGYKKPVKAAQDVVPQDVKKTAEPVDLSGVAGKTPANTDNARQAQMPTNRTLIDAPVKVLKIENAEQYKQFKQTARGLYPQADFETEQVIVLESQSNLPDKVFEIAQVVPAQGSMVVLYRVNVFGLDEKTNTHSAVKMPKTDLPVELKQVL